MMKNCCWLVLLIVISFSTLIFPQETNVSTQTNTESLIRSGEFLNKDGLHQLVISSYGLSNDYKTLLYNQYAKNRLLVSLNFFVPGLGSWLIGDKANALIIEIGFGAISGLALLEYIYEGEHSFHHGLIATLLVSCAWATQLFFGLGSGDSFIENYNYRLKTGLGITANDNPVFHDLPIFTMNPKNPMAPQLFELNFITIKF